MTSWLPVPGFEGRYEVSDDGQVKVLAGPGRGRFNVDRVLKVGRDGNGYLQVLLYPGGGQKYLAKRVHILVLEAFIGPRPEGAFGLHSDDDRNNNRLANLRWGTRSENSVDMVLNGRHNNARRSSCKRGHPLTGPPGGRTCVTCRARSRAKYEARRKAAAA